MQDHSRGKGYLFAEENGKNGFLSLVPAVMPHRPHPHPHPHHPHQHYHHQQQPEQQQQQQYAACLAGLQQHSAGNPELLPALVQALGAVPSPPSSASSAVLSPCEGDANNSSQSSSSNSLSSSSPKERDYMGFDEVSSSSKLIVLASPYSESRPDQDPTDLQLGLGPPGPPPAHRSKDAAFIASNQLSKDNDALDKATIPISPHIASAVWPAHARMHRNLEISTSQSSSCVREAADGSRRSLANGCVWPGSSAFVARNSVKRAYEDAMRHNHFPPSGVVSQFVGTMKHDLEMKQLMAQQARVQSSPYIHKWPPIQPGTFSSIQQPPIKGIGTVAATVETSPDVLAKECKANPKQPAQQDVPTNDKLQVVGWPPVRSFRKNTLAAHSKTADVMEEYEETEDSASGPSKSSLYVKVNMHGVPIGRKVDLNVCKGYEDLTAALEEMFQRFATENHASCGQTSIPRNTMQLQLFKGSNYVLIYEDKEGDWMLVGDVPWGMFVNSVRRLLIMKATEVTGLVPRCPRNQASVCEARSFVGT